MSTDLILLLVFQVGVAVLCLVRVRANRDSILTIQRILFEEVIVKTEAGQKSIREMGMEPGGREFAREYKRDLNEQ